MRGVTTLPIVLLVACGGGGGAAEDAQHLTTTPEGVTFAVPLGFSYEVRTEGTSRTYLMKSGSAGVALTVAKLAGGTCPAAFVTAHGLPGCGEEMQVQGGSAAAVVVRGGVLDVGVVTTVTDGSALRLARAVADTVVIPTSPGAQSGSATPNQATDERFYNCFSEGSSFMGVSSESSLCLYDDGTFEYRSMAHAGSYDPHGQADVTSSAYGDGGDSGNWWVEPVDLGDQKQHWNLHLVFDNGQDVTWEVRFYNGDLVRGDTELWSRT